MYVYYCPICGGINRRDKSTYICRDCQSTVPDVKSEHEIDYYEQKSVTLYDTSKFWNYLLLEEEIKNGPLYDESKLPRDALLKLEKQHKEIQQIIEKQERRKQNLGYGSIGYTPLLNCPACNSPNVRKISEINIMGMMAGGFSVGDIGKQYECNNCGMKF